MDLVTEYLKLGLRFDRIVDGFVDAYTGDPALRLEVADEPAPEPVELSRQAAALSSAVIADTDLAPARAAFLTAHLDALSLAGRRLAGESMSLVDEVAGYFQVTIELVDTDVFADAHARIGELLGPRSPGLPRSSAGMDRRACSSRGRTCRSRRGRAASRPSRAAATCSRTSSGAGDRAVVIATGSEVALAMGAPRCARQGRHRGARGVDAVHERVRPAGCRVPRVRAAAGVPRVAVEAGVTDGWRKYVGAADDPAGGRRHRHVRRVGAGGRAVQALRLHGRARGRGGAAVVAA